MAIFWSMCSDLWTASNHVPNVVEAQKKSFRLAKEDMKGGKPLLNFVKCDLSTSDIWGLLALAYVLGSVRQLLKISIDK